MAQKSKLNHPLYGDNGEKPPFLAVFAICIKKFSKVKKRGIQPTGLISL